MEKAEKARILREAAGYIRGGFVTYRCHNEVGDCCALGALENAVAGRRLRSSDRCPSGDDRIQPVIKLLADEIRRSKVEVDPKVNQRQWGDAGWVADWNNIRTAEQVASTMECLADGLLEED